MNNSLDKKNLLVLASTYPRWIGDHEPGFVHELTKRLIDEFNVTVICPHAIGAKTYEYIEGIEVYRYKYAPNKLETLVNDGGIITNLKKSPWKILLLPSFFLGQLFLVKKIITKHKVDVIHAHWLIPQGLILALISIFMKIPPFLVTSHGADLFSLKGTFFNKLKLFVAHKASHLCVVSKVMKDIIIQWGINNEKVTVKPMGVNMDNFTVIPTIKRSSNEILFVGRLVEKKGLCNLITALPEIIKHHPDAYLTIVGFGPEEIKLKQQTQSLKIQSKVNFVGAVSQQNLPKYYQRAALFVAPFIEAKSGDQEGLGLVLVEALACGCQVVVSDIPACQDVIENITNVRVFDSKSAVSLKTAILQSLKFKESTSLSKGVNKIIALQKFDWSDVSKNYAMTLKDISKNT